MCIRDRLLIEMAQPFPNCKREVEESVESGSFERAASLLCEEMGEFEFLRKLHGTFGRHTLSQAIARLSLIHILRICYIQDTII